MKQKSKAERSKPGQMHMLTDQGASGGSQHGHAHCLFCGDQNPWSRRLRFSATKDGSVCAEFQAQPELQGYDGMLHGGVISALLDVAMTHCLFHRGIQAVTGQMNVTFCEAISCDALIQAKARVVSAWSPLFCMEAELIHEGRIKAKANAKFVLRPDRRA